jgi:sRNA-binding carbon storage regulator CsrA
MSVESGTLLYWVDINQTLCIGDAQITITLKDTARGRARLRIQAPKDLKIETSKPLQFSNQDKTPNRG